MAKTNEVLALMPNYKDLVAVDDSLASKRYERYRSGKTVEQIAKADGVKPETVRLDILAYEKKYELLTQNAIQRERLEGELSNEKLRTAIRARVHKKVLKSIDVMVEGKRKFVSFDQASGKYVTITAVDYQMMLAGIKEFQKLVSLEQKPSVPHTVVNVNQTNVTTGRTEDFEERIRRIKQEQKESIAAAEAKVIDVEPIEEEVEEEEEKKEPEWDF